MVERHSRKGVCLFVSVHSSGTLDWSHQLCSGNSRMLTLVIITGLLAHGSSTPCVPTDPRHSEVQLTLNKELLWSAQGQAELPNPSVFLALRLSANHNLGVEAAYLNKLKNDLHSSIQSSLSTSQSMVGLLALYMLALRASCVDLNTVHFTVTEDSVTVLTLLKRQMEREKEHITFSRRPLTNYYQYSQGVLALCVSGVRVNPHVSNKLIKAIEHQHIQQESGSIDTLAMAGMALQCLQDTHVLYTADPTTALRLIKEGLLASQRADGHMGNEFSTGLAVQALLAMGAEVPVCAAPMEAMRTSARSNTYHNPMAISQTLPALQRKTYLHVMTKECRGETDSLVLEPKVPLVLVPSPHVSIRIEVVKSGGNVSVYSVNVPKGSSLLEALEHLHKKNGDFTFHTESSLWGPFLSMVNGELARQIDRRYWNLSVDGFALSQGIKDYKIEADQKVIITNKAY